MDIKIGAANDEGSLTLDPSQLNDGIGIFTLDKQGDGIKAVYFSALALKILGLPDALNLPCRLEALGLPEHEQSLYLQKIRQALTTGEPAVFVQRLYGPEDAPRYRSVCLKPVSFKDGDDSVEYLLELSRDVSTQHHALEELTEANVRLMVSQEQTAQRLWELNFADNTFTFFNPSRGALGERGRALRFPEDLLAKDWVHPDSLANFRLFARKLLGGDKRGGGAFILKTWAGSGYAWFAVSFRTLYHPDKTPYKAIGIVSPLDPRLAYPRFALYGRLWEYLLSDLYSYTQVNLTQQRVDQIWISGRNISYWAASITYSKFLENAFKRVFAHEERAQLQQLFSRDNLLELYERGQRWIFAQFAVVEHGGYVRNIAAYALLCKDAESGEIYCFAYLQYVDKAVSRDGDQRREAARLPYSGLYDLQSLKLLATHYENEFKGPCAHILINISADKKPLNPGDYNFAANAFALYFESFALTGQLPRSTLNVFIPDCQSVLKARQYADDAFIFVRRILAETPLADVRFTVVLCQGQLKAKFFDSFIIDGMKELQHLEGKSTDYIQFMPAKSDLEEYALPGHEYPYNHLYTTDLSALRYARLKEQLSSEEEQIVFKSMDIMLTSTNYVSALQWILGLIGSYFSADRVYALQVVDGGKAVEEIGEWDEGGKPSFRGMLSGISLDRLPLLRRALAGRPIYLSRMRRMMAVQTNDHVSESWSFAVYPLNTVNGFNALICIDNPQRHDGNLSLVAVLKNYLTLMLQRLLKERYDYMNLHAVTAGVYDMRSYREQIALFNSDVYSSLGVFTLAFPQILQLSREYGYEHCVRLISFVLELLRRSFGNSFIFRSFDSEFIILVPNTTKKIFFDRVARVQTVIDRNYPGHAVYGSTWSRGAFSGGNLVQEALTLMLSSQPQLSAKASPSGESPELEGYSSALTEKFTVFFQPKVDMHTGKLMGAEALVRGIGEDGSIVPPMRFISRMEKDGTLRELDLFVLSRVLWQQQRWEQQGLKTVPVSVNFSRFTLFDNSTVGAVLAILSHYREEAADKIEIEVTETACAVEDVTLKRALQPLRSLGLHFSLDDFGTGYANLSLFSKVHFDSIKIDRSLISDISVNKVSQSLLQSIVRISADSQMTVIAEGVEYQDQVDVLLKSGCTIAQGFLYDKAMDADKFAGKYLQVSQK